MRFGACSEHRFGELGEQLLGDVAVRGAPAATAPTVNARSPTIFAGSTSDSTASTTSSNRGCSARPIRVATLIRTDASNDGSTAISASSVSSPAASPSSSSIACVNCTSPSSGASASARFVIASAFSTRTGDGGGSSSSSSSSRSSRVVVVVVERRLSSSPAILLGDQRLRFFRIGDAVDLACATPSPSRMKLGVTTMRSAGQRSNR